MSTGYLIGPMGDTEDWKLDEDTIATSLTVAWRTINMRRNPPGDYTIDWQAQVKNSLVIGGVQSDRRTMSIETGNIVALAEFAIWYRGLVPHAHKLFLYNASTLQNPLELRSDTSIEEIVNALNQH